MATQYDDPADPERGLTPSRLKRLGRARQVAVMVQWFRGRYEDPQNETPYADKDDDSPYNYRYIWGGPYDAREELEHEFAGLVSDDALEAAINEVESDGIVEWAPGPGHPDRLARESEAMAYEDARETISLDAIQQRIDSGVRPEFGDEVERRAGGAPAGNRRAAGSP